MGMKMDCEGCRTGEVGHYGHWMRNATGWEMGGTGGQMDGGMVIP